MVQLWSDIREDIRKKPCLVCGKAVKKPKPTEDVMLSFYRGEFGLFHGPCYSWQMGEISRLAGEANPYPDPRKEAHNAPQTE